MLYDGRHTTLAAVPSSEAGSRTKTVVRLVQHGKSQLVTLESPGLWA